mmetsp:Transcript_6087/g.19679  ORF Transcript_6087/g.19679 Transcript_6087/m.19679 type:complete len:316 (-) Transcript_6087:1884-2831(-)
MPTKSSSSTTVGGASDWGGIGTFPGTGGTAGATSGTSLATAASSALSATSTVCPSSVGSEIGPPAAARLEPMVAERSERLLSWSRICRTARSESSFFSLRRKALRSSTKDRAFPGFGGGERGAVNTELATDPASDIWSTTCFLAAGVGVGVGDGGPKKLESDWSPVATRSPAAVCFTSGPFSFSKSSSLSCDTVDEVLLSTAASPGRAALVLAHVGSRELSKSSSGATLIPFPLSFSSTAAPPRCLSASCSFRKVEWSSISRSRSFMDAVISGASRHTNIQPSHDTDTTRLQSLLNVSPVMGSLWPADRARHSPL